MKEQLESLNSVSINFGESGIMIVNIILAFVMFGIALGIKVETFKEIFKKPKSIIVGVLLQWVALPLITLIVALALSPWITPMIALGMILVASCPGGNMSNFMSSLSKGNVELSVSLTAITTAAAPFVTPFNFFLYSSIYTYVINIKNDIPTLVIPFLPMLEQILLLLGIPIVLGILFAHYFPKATKKISKPAQILSILLFMGMIVVSFAQNFQIFIDNIFYVFLHSLITQCLCISNWLFWSKIFKATKERCENLNDRGRNTKLRFRTNPAFQSCNLPS